MSNFHITSYRVAMIKYPYFLKVPHDYGRASEVKFVQLTCGHQPFHSLGKDFTI